MVYSQFAPFRYLKHAVQVLTGKFDDPDAPGDINHFQALSSALSATIGMGNISGVAVAIATGGPGAVFWMWVSAFIGIATKFFTCTLSIMYRGTDSRGNKQGGTMYMLQEGLAKRWGKSWKPLWTGLAFLFAFAGLFGALPIFQANQMTQVLRDVIYIPGGLVTEQAHFYGDLLTGIGILVIVSLVIFGGIKRIGKVASRLVPFMIVLYLILIFIILGIHIDQVPYYLKLIVTDAFSAQAAMGGAIGALIIKGFKRAAFSNEAGIGTATMAHGAAKTKEPVREGLVAMLGPFIDTLIVCTLTAMAILVTGVWQTGSENGITLTASAFGEALGTLGPTLLVLCVTVFAFSTLFTYSYYGSKCLGFLAGVENQKYYNYFYAISIVLGAVVSLDAVIDLIDGMFAVMAIPTMVAALALSPRVKEAAKDYFSRIDKFEEYETDIF